MKTRVTAAKYQDRVNACKGKLDADTSVEGQTKHREDNLQFGLVVHHALRPDEYYLFERDPVPPGHNGL
jgi:hypothetical protein